MLARPFAIAQAVRLATTSAPTQAARSVGSLGPRDLAPREAGPMCSPARVEEP
jgi:hypothetical protein